MKILAMVGSVCLEGNEEAYRLAQDVLETRKPNKVVSGGARGFDTISIEVAEMLGIPWEEYLPAGRGWEFFKVRNQKIADVCTELFRAASARSTTYGSGWTRDRAKEQGKPTQEVKLP